MESLVDMVCMILPINVIILKIIIFAETIKYIGRELVALW